MESEQKSIQLQKILNSLNEFRANLTYENLSEFDFLRSKALTLLEENQRLRFNRIEFYSEVPDYRNLSADDLPF